VGILAVGADIAEQVVGVASAEVEAPVVEEVAVLGLLGASEWLEHSSQPHNPQASANICKVD
jgi:hypothetical protein